MQHISRLTRKNELFGVGRFERFLHQKRSGDEAVTSLVTSSAGLQGFWTKNPQLIGCYRAPFPYYSRQWLTESSVSFHFRCLGRSASTRVALLLPSNGFVSSTR